MFAKNTTPKFIPSFCPNCNKKAPDDDEKALCHECGATLIPQGYCPVCERYWRLAAEAMCPKHDIALEVGPAATSEPIAAGQPISWVTVKVFPDSLSAAIPRSRLEAEDIRTFLEGERMGSPAMYHVATGGVKLQVPADQETEARIVLSQSWALPGDEKADFDDLL